MEVNQEKLDNLMTKSLSGSNEESLTTIKDENNKENQLLNENEDKKSDQSLFDMIKSRPKRLNRKVPSRLKSTIDKPNNLINTAKNIDEKKPNQSSAKSTTNSSLDFGLDTFFQSSSVTLKRRTFADVYPKDEVSSRSSSQTSKSDHNSNDANNNNKEMNNNNHGNKDETKLCPLSMADKIARSRSSPNLIDPRKMLLPGDPRHNLSMIKELRSRQKSGESTEISHNNNLNHHSSLLSELKAKNKPFCSRKDAPSLVNKDKPPISLLKPSLKSLSASSSGSSLSSSVQQSGQLFNVKLRETKPNKVNNLIKSYTRASFPVNSETDSDQKVKRNSEPNFNHDNQEEEEEKKDNSDSVSGGEDDKRLSKEASALNADEKEEESHRSSRESSSSSSEEEEEEDGKKEEDEKDDNCHQNGTKSSS